MKVLNLREYLTLKKLLFFVMLVSVCLTVSKGLNAKQKPNIVLIFIDDMGYGDIGCFGSNNHTPQLDKLAAEGMKFTDFYVSSTNCTPSRAALLTGCYADRVGMDGEVVFPADPRGLNPSEITIAEMLSKEGYATGCFGKWHLGDAPELMPLNQGFDKYEGIPYSNDMWIHNKKRKKEGWPPLPYVKQNKVVAHIPDAKSQALMCEATTNAAIDFIRQHKNEPFFAYLPYSYVHLPRLVEKSWADKANGNITRAQIEELDERVGQIISTIREIGIEKNTLVFFTSDNGGASGTSMGPLRGKKSHQKYEGSMREPTIAWWPGKIKAGSVSSEIAATIDILPTLAALTGAKVPTDRVIDGKDISKLFFKAKAKSPHKVLYYEYQGIRIDDWKLVIPSNQKQPLLPKGIKAELYNLKEDIGETKNLAELYPEKVKEMEKLLEEHARYVKDNQRPAAFVENTKPLLPHSTGIPTLAEYMNRTNMETAGSITKKRK